MNDIEILKGLISLIKVHNGKFSDDDIALLKGIYRIVNDRWITIHPHGDDYVEMRMGNFTEQLQYLKDNEPKLVNKLDTLYNKIASEMDKL